MSSTPTEDGPLSLPALRRFLNVSTRPEDEADLEETLNAALERVQGMVTVDLHGTDAVTYRPRRRSSGALLIPPGATEVVSITDPYGVVRPAVDLDVDLDAGIIWPGPFDLRPGAWTVTVRRPGAGAAVTLAVKIIAKHLWGVHRGDGSRSGPRGGVIAQDEAALAGFAIPRRARELLEPFMAGGGFA